MKDTEQAPGQNIIQHGLKVFQYTNKLLNQDYEGITLPQWWDEFKEQIYSDLHDFKSIKHYTTFHDMGKPFCLEIDDEGKRHFPKHAQISKDTWLKLFPEKKDIARLIEHDMVFHAMSAKEILSLGLSRKDMNTLMLVSLAELHSNAETFYSNEGTSSTWFKIKFKKWNKIAKRICTSIRDHAYMYVLVRKDLPGSQQAVQAAHAAIEATRTYLTPEDAHPSVIICSVKNESKLLKCAKELADSGIEFQLFKEPDMNNECTALACSPLVGDDRQPFKKYQLLNL